MDISGNFVKKKDKLFLPYRGNYVPHGLPVRLGDNIIPNFAGTPITTNNDMTTNNIDVRDDRAITTNNVMTTNNNNTAAHHTHHTHHTHITHITTHITHHTSHITHHTSTHHTSTHHTHQYYLLSCHYLLLLVSLQN